MQTPRDRSLLAEATQLKVRRLLTVVPSTETLDALPFLAAAAAGVLVGSRPVTEEFLSVQDSLCAPE